MHEIELKFVIPENKVAAVKKQTFVKTAQQHRLDAYYFDTPDQQLGKAGIALRIRCENGHWVQTLKAKGDGLAKRIEENISLDLPMRIAQTKLKPDLSLHSLSIQTLLSSVMPLDGLTESLTIKFATKVQRITREIKRHGNVVEVAFDQGKVISGRRSSPICEVEFELLQGNMDFLIDTASAWVKRHGLWYSTVSKAEAGSRLFMGALTGKVVKADLNTFKTAVSDTNNKKISQDAFIRLVVQNCLQQILPNVSNIAASQLGSVQKPLDGNHVHQARVGIRRLRTALKSFTDFASETDLDPNIKARIHGWQKQLKATFTLLGAYRDLEILQTKTQPMLATLGAPHIDWQMNLTVEPSEAIQNKDFQLILLEMLAFASQAATKSKPAKPELTRVLSNAFKKVANPSTRFAALENAQQHEVRKRLKKLRYLCEFAAPLYACKSLKGNRENPKKDKPNRKAQNKTVALKPSAFIKHLEPAQDILGEFNDAAVGLAAYRQLVTTEPKAWFAVGYFTASEASAAKDCATALKTVKDAPCFW